MQVCKLQITSWQTNVYYLYAIIPYTIECTLKSARRNERWVPFLFMVFLRLWQGLRFRLIHFTNSGQNTSISYDRSKIIPHKFATNFYTQLHTRLYKQIVNEYTILKLFWNGATWKLTKSRRIIALQCIAHIRRWFLVTTLFLELISNATVYANDGIHPNHQLIRNGSNQHLFWAILATWARFLVAQNLIHNTGIFTVFMFSTPDKVLVNLVF